MSNEPVQQLTPITLLVCTGVSLLMWALIAAPLLWLVS